MDMRDKVMSDFMMIWFLMLHQRRAEGGRQRGPGARRTTSDRVFDPTQGQGRIIAMLKLRDGLSTKDLATVLGIRVSSLNETLAKMEKAGLVERKPSEADKRVMLIYLTDAGRAVEFPDEGEVDLLAGFSDEEVEALAGYLERIVANLEEYVGPDTVAALRASLEEREAFFADAGERARRHPFTFAAPFRGRGPVPPPAPPRPQGPFRR